MSNAPRPDPRFRLLSPELLASISADEIGDAVLQHVQLHLDRGAGVGSLLARLPAGIRAVYATWLVDADVNNGGFNQFFYNHDERMAGEALLGYELFGAEDYADVMRAAIATFEVERDRLLPYYERGTLEAFSQSYRHTELDTVDQRYYALGDRIHTVWAIAVRDHPELFRTC